MSGELVVLAGLELGEQLPGVLLNLGEFRDESLPVHLSCNITISLGREEGLSYPEFLVDSKHGGCQKIGLSCETEAAGDQPGANNRHLAVCFRLGGVGSSK